ncbi:MAG: DUF1292 domain-containing protein [Eubacterium sp.]|nr:DUF1292 domain-containing protein [Eubacterium sp.]
MESLLFTDPKTGETAELYVIEETVLSGITYLLVSLEEEGDSEALILKALPGSEEEITYEIVDDEKEMDAISRIFMEILDDVTFE